jgi:hypothetical protein
VAGGMGSRRAGRRTGRMGAVGPTGATCAVRGGRGLGRPGCRARWPPAR